MRGQKILVKFDGGLGYLTPDHGLNSAQMDMGVIGRFKRDAYCEIDITGYDVSTGELRAYLVSYSVGQVDFPASQLRLAGLLANVKSIKFNSLSTTAMLNLMDRAIYTPGSVDKVARGEFTQMTRSSPNAKKESEVHEEEKLLQVSPPEMKVETLRFSFRQPIKDVRFEAACVRFTKYLSEIKQTLDIVILNGFLRVEFDAIKNYFPKVLGTEKLLIQVVVEVAGQKVIRYSATSQQIDLIDQNLLERSILVGRKQFVKDLKKELKDGGVYTMEEIFEKIGENNSTGHILFGKDDDFMESVCSIENAKHYKHLRYLSDKHASKMMKLRFITEPFSFLFLVEGNNSFHLVWETLNTKEATYIWHIQKDTQLLQKLFKNVEAIIEEMCASGKLAYIQNSEDDYSRIYHDYSSGVEGFIKWKDEIEECLAGKDFSSSYL